MVKRYVIALIAAVFSMFVGAGIAFAVPPAPTLERPVVDTTGTLSEKDIDRISAAVGNRPSQKEAPQIAVALIDDLGGWSVEDRAMEYATKWGVGDDKYDNGVLIFVAKNDKKIRIEVGKGADSALTDADSRDIIEDVAIPLLKKGEWATALEKTSFSVRDKVDGLDNLETPSFDVTVYATTIVSIALLLGGVTMFFKAARGVASRRRERDEMIAEAQAIIAASKEKADRCSEMIVRLDKQNAELNDRLDKKQKAPDIEYLGRLRNAVIAAEKEKDKLDSQESRFLDARREYTRGKVQEKVGRRENLTEKDLLALGLSAATIPVATSIMRSNVRRRKDDEDRKKREARRSRNSAIAAGFYGSSGGGSSYSGGSSFGGGDFGGGGASGSW